MKYLFLLLICILLLGACQKKEGCTDINAVNYDPEAVIDDSSCKYCDPDESLILGLLITSDDPSDLELYLNMDSFPITHKGCSLDINIYHSFPSEEITIQWEPAEIFDCATCFETILSPIETTVITLDIEHQDGYFLRETREVYVQ